jgi:NhaP-type Na+/H+ or K+/H+ antiporter
VLSDLSSLVVIVALGIGAQWIAWRVRAPSILLLLVFGVLAGPVTGLIDPDELVGDLLYPATSLAVALILFEGGLSLRIGELGENGRTVLRLVLVGGLVTWLLASMCARAVIDVPASVALLTGAIFVVTGPTVIVPLLRQLSLRPRLAAVLKWEGILNDPIGALLAVIVFEAVLAGSAREATAMTIANIGQAIIAGAVVGLGGAAALVVALKRYYIPDFLESPLSLVAVGAALIAGDSIQQEAGLLAVTIMGVALSVQTTVPVRRILEFKENLRVLLISSLFIVLAARVNLAALGAIAVPATLYLACLVLIVRPASVALATIGSPLEWRERAMLMCVAPRGIVAAAMATVFALRLESAGSEGAELLVPLVFFVIAGSIVVYSIPAPALARALRVAGAPADGLLFLGAHSWARELAATLVGAGVRVVLVDDNYFAVRAARMRGLTAHYGNLVTDHPADEFDLDGIGNLLALTANYSANALACVHMAETFDVSRVFQLAPEVGATLRADPSVPLHLRGRTLFAADMSYTEIEDRIWRGWSIKRTKLSEEFSGEAYGEKYGTDLVLLFLVRDEGAHVDVFTTDQAPALAAGASVVSLVPPDADS